MWITTIRTGVIPAGWRLMQRSLEAATLVVYDVISPRLGISYAQVGGLNTDLPPTSFASPPCLVQTIDPPGSSASSGRDWRQSSCSNSGHHVPPEPCIGGLHLLHPSTEMYIGELIHLNSASSVGTSPPSIRAPSLPTPGPSSMQPSAIFTDRAGAPLALQVMFNLLVLCIVAFAGYSLATRDREGQRPTAGAGEETDGRTREDYPPFSEARKRRRGREGDLADVWFEDEEDNWEGQRRPPRNARDDGESTHRQYIR